MIMSPIPRSTIHLVGGVILDTSVPHPARVYDYWLGGKDNFAADRQVAEQILRVMPVMPQIARSCRLFLSAVVHHLAADLGVRQFLDIGTGLPTADNTARGRAARGARGADRPMSTTTVASRVVRTSCPQGDSQLAGPWRGV